MYYISANYTELITGKDFQKQLFFNKPHFPGKKRKIESDLYFKQYQRQLPRTTSWTEDVEEQVIIDNNNCNPAAKSALLAP